MRITYFRSQVSLLLVLGLLLIGCSKAPEQTQSNLIKSEIKLVDGQYQLLLNGEPFFIKGAGLSGGNMEALAAHGANAFRTWHAGDGQEVMDQAMKLDLKVALGIWVGLERNGFDYDNEEAVAKQLEDIKAQVMTHKDHPALMIWVLGNELNHHSTNPKVWDAVNDISKMIHEIDPNHLITTPLAGMKKWEVDLVMERAPDLDFLSIQLYGEMDKLGELIKETEYDGPLLITEWGATGYWEVPKTPWEAPIENNSSVKADLYRSRYEQAILGNSKQVIGSFVFLWGQKQERTPTWFGMFLANGKETESVDVMHFNWTGKWPDNRSPRLEAFSLNGRGALDSVMLQSNAEYEASATVVDPDQDALDYQWVIMEESTTKATGGDREEIPQSLEGLILKNEQGTISFKAPEKVGAYRLFLYVDDGNDHTAHANIPFWVE